MCGGSHILDLIHWFAGRPLQVCGRMRRRPELDFEYQANAMLWHDKDAVTHLECCWHPLKFAGYERNGWDERLEINTVKGRLDFFTVTWNMPERNGALLVHQDAETGVTKEYRYPAVNPFHIEMADMLRRFEARQAPMPSAWDGYVVDETIAAITTSAAENRIVEMKWRDQ